MPRQQTSKVDFDEISKNHYRVRGVERTKVDPHLFVDPPILETVRRREDDSLKQLLDAASLPGVRYVGGMPDLHEGYGVPVGCVMAMDAREGLVSAGAVGMDINCGVRLLTTKLSANSLNPDELKSIGRAILNRVPVGIGTSSPYMDELDSRVEELLLEGVGALEDTNYIEDGDRDLIQDRGCYPDARLDPVTDEAWDRLDQFGTLGGGNHFLEIVTIDDVNEPSVCSDYGVSEGRLGFLIHTGSRGFGHQICVDYSERMLESADQFDLRFPSDNLASAPIQSELGRDYLSAMACAANVAYANRQMITYSVRDACREFFRNRSEDPDPSIVYDITHNLARFETIDSEEYLVHRKGAVRSLPSNHDETPEPYSETGHPVIVPGNMATGSYLLRAGRNINKTFNSINHGAGRSMSRTAAKDEISEQMLLEALGDVQLLGASRKKIRDEAPQAYKNLHTVIDVLTETDIAELLAHLQPLVVIKGD